jgi:branched-chain amino acid transport system substrate-binding protein
MSQKKDTPALILALLITLGLIGGGLWLFGKPLLQGLNPSGQTSGSNGNSNGNNSSGTVQLSQGDVSLVAEPSNDKQRGIDAIKAGNLDQAIPKLEAALRGNPNDPESLIYLNNAKVGNQDGLAIAVTIPYASNPTGALEMLRGVAQAQDEVNKAGGINGKLLKVVIANDGGNAEGAKQVAQALVSQAEVLGVVGHFSSSQSLAAGPIYEQGNLLMVSPVSTSTELTGSGKYIFRTVPSDSVAAQALADYAIGTLNSKKVAVFYNSADKYSTSLYKAFTDKMNASPETEQLLEYDFASSGFNPQASYEQASNQGAIAIALFPNTDKLDESMIILKQNQRKLPIVAGDDVYSPDVLKGAGGDAEGVVIAIPWHILSDPQSTFAQTSQKLWRATVNWRTAMSYDAAIALVEAMKRNPNRSGMREALVAGDFSPVGATGMVKFRPSGDRNQKVQLVTVKPGNRSGTGYDFVPLK